MVDDRLTVEDRIENELMWLKHITNSSKMSENIETL